jgi:hypothetical protein
MSGFMAADSQALRDALLRILAPRLFTPSDRCSASLAHSEFKSVSGTGTAAAAATVALLTPALLLPPLTAPLPLAGGMTVSGTAGGGRGRNWKISTTAGCSTDPAAAKNSTKTMTGSFQSRPSSESDSAVGIPAAAADDDVAPAAAAGWKGSTPRCKSLLVTCAKMPAASKYSPSFT